MTIKCDEGTYEYVRATVLEDGIAVTYRAPELTIAGSDFIDDEGASNWTDEEVRDTVALYLGITDGKKEIEVEHD